jgi:hypothetical protein
VLITNGVMIMVFLPGKSVRSSDLIGVLFRKVRKTLYGNKNKSITFSLLTLNIKNLAKGLLSVP